MHGTIPHLYHPGASHLVLFVNILQGRAVSGKCGAEVTGGAPENQPSCSIAWLPEVSSVPCPGWELFSKLPSHPEAVRVSCSPAPVTAVSPGGRARCAAAAVCRLQPGGAQLQGVSAGGEPTPPHAKAS